MEPPPTSVYVRTRAFAIDIRRIRQVAQTCLTTLGLADRELSLSFVNSTEIRSLNRRFRGKDKATDVLSFPQTQFARPLLPRRAANSTEAARNRAPKLRPAAKRRRRAPEPLGDVVISMREAATNARGIGQGLDREVAFLIVHGVLHLCGHDHHTRGEERVMLAAQRALMAALERGAKPAWQGCATRARRR